MSVFFVSILAADCAFYEGPCEYMSVPCTEGQLGIMAHHSNFIAAVVPGKLSFRVPGEDARIAFVSEGLVKAENNEVLVLVDSAQRPEDIDENRARKSVDEAKEALLQKRGIQENRLAQAQLARAVSRLRVKNSFENL